MKYLYLFCAILLALQTKAQVTLKENQLIKIHEVTTAQRNSLQPNSGAVVYDTDEETLYVYDTSIPGWVRHRYIGSDTKIESTESVTVEGQGIETNPYLIGTTTPTLTRNPNGTFTYLYENDSIEIEPVTDGTPGTLSPVYYIDDGFPMTANPSTVRYRSSEKVIINGKNFTPFTKVSSLDSNIIVDGFSVQDSKTIEVNVTSGGILKGNLINIKNSSSDITTTLTTHAIIPDENLIIDGTDVGGLTYSNGVLKSTRNNAWSKGDAYTTSFIPANKAGSISVTVDLDNMYEMVVALDVDSSDESKTGTTYTKVTYGIYFFSFSFRGFTAAYLMGYEKNGAFSKNLTTLGGAYLAPRTGDVVSIKKDASGQVTFWLNDVKMYTSLNLATSNLYGILSLKSLNHSCSNVSFYVAD